MANSSSEEGDGVVSSVWLNNSKIFIIVSLGLILIVYYVKVNQGLGTYALFGSVSRLVCGRNISSSPFTSGGTANRWGLSVILTLTISPLFQVWQPTRPDPGEGGRLDQVQVRQHNQPGVQRPHRVHGEFAGNQVSLDLSAVELDMKYLYSCLLRRIFLLASSYLRFFLSVGH